VCAQDIVPKSWVVNLDNPPSSRWPIAEMAPYYNQTIHETIALINEILPEWLQPTVVDIAADLVFPNLGEYADEIKMGADCLKMPLGVAVLLNIFYEIEAGCTSIVAQDEQGKIFHGRNLDFDLAKSLRKLVIKVEFQKQGKTLFWGTTYAGYIGVLTGMKPGSFAISLNERDTGYMVENLLEALLIPGTRIASFLIRDTLTNIQTFDEAIQVISSASLVAPAYIIVSGANPGEGAVITRNRYNVADLWKLDLNLNRWFLVETNDDHWLPPDDDRRDLANIAMNAIGEKGIDLDGLYQVLSVRHVLNSQTTYTTLMSATTGNFTVFVRNVQ